MSASWDNILRNTAVIHRIDGEIVNLYCSKRFPPIDDPNRVLVVFNYDVSPEHVYNSLKDLKSFSMKMLDKLDIEIYIDAKEGFVCLCVMADLRDALSRYFNRPKSND